jgi:hypothetical protein
MDVQKITLASYIAGGAGAALLLLSFVFPYIFTDRGAWSDADGQDFAAAASDLHRLTHSHGEHGHSHADNQPNSDAAALAAARERFESEKQRLNSAVSGRHFSRSLVKWTGVLLIIVAAAGVGYLRMREFNS